MCWLHYAIQQRHFIVMLQLCKDKNMSPAQLKRYKHVLFSPCLAQSGTGKKFNDNCVFSKVSRIVLLTYYHHNGFAENQHGCVFWQQYSDNVPALTNIQ